MIKALTHIKIGDILRQHYSYGVVNSHITCKQERVNKLVNHLLDLTKQNKDSLITK